MMMMDEFKIFEFMENVILMVRIFPFDWSERLVPVFKETEDKIYIEDGSTSFRKSDGTKIRSTRYKYGDYKLKIWEAENEKPKSIKFN